MAGRDIQFWPGVCRLHDGLRRDRALGRLFEILDHGSHPRWWNRVSTCVGLLTSTVSTGLMQPAVGGGEYGEVLQSYGPTASAERQELARSAGSSSTTDSSRHAAVIDNPASFKGLNEM